MTVIGPSLAGRFINVAECGEEIWAVSVKGVTQSRLLQALVIDLSEYGSLWLARHADDGIMMHYTGIVNLWASELVFFTDDERIHVRKDDLSRRIRSHDATGLGGWITIGICRPRCDPHGREDRITTGTG